MQYLSSHLVGAMMAVNFSQRFMSSFRSLKSPHKEVSSQSCSITYRNHLVLFMRLIFLLGKAGTFSFSILYSWIVLPFVCYRSVLWWKNKSTYILIYTRQCKENCLLTIIYNNFIFRLFTFYSFYNEKVPNILVLSE